MKKAIGSFILGVVFGGIGMFELFSSGLYSTSDRGPTIYDDEKIRIKQCQTKGGTLLNLAMIFNKLN